MTKKRKKSLKQKRQEERARAAEAQARAKLVDLCLRSVGAARPDQIRHAFGWKMADVNRAIDQLVDEARALRLPDGRVASQVLLNDACLQA